MKDIEEIYEKYAQIVYKYIFSLSREKDLSEEIVQETFLVAVKDINKFEGKSSLSTWLCSIAKNIYYKKLKKARKDISLDSIYEITNFENIPDEIVCENESKLELIKSLQKLDEETRNVMYLRIYVELSYEEIGEVFGKSSNWARVTFFRGKQKIKGLLE